MPPLSHGTHPTHLVFISWAEGCSRSDGIARGLGGTSIMVYSPFWGSRYSTILFKYLWQGIKTLRVLFRHKPRAVLVMTPPVIACIPVWLYCLLTGSQYAIDAHTGAFVDQRWQSTLFLHRFFSRHAAATLVTNDFLADIVRGWKATAQILSDVPIDFPEPSQMPLKGDMKMAFISSFTPDEPLEKFLEAARKVPEVEFYVTGKPRNPDVPELKRAPNNVTLTGYLSNADYAGLLLAVDAVICLTTADHTMQRGAYEAVYLAKPVITSNFGILRHAFNKGTVHVDNDPADMARGFRQMRTNLEQYRAEIEVLRLEKLGRWRLVQMELLRMFELAPAGEPQPSSE